MNFTYDDIHYSLDNEALDFSIAIGKTYSLKVLNGVIKWTNLQWGNERWHKHRKTPFPPLLSQEHPRKIIIIEPKIGECKEVDRIVNESGKPLEEFEKKPKS